MGKWNYLGVEIIVGDNYDRIGFMIDLIFLFFYGEINYCGVIETFHSTN